MRHLPLCVQVYSSDCLNFGQLLRNFCIADLLRREQSDSEGLMKDNDKPIKNEIERTMVVVLAFISVWLFELAKLGSDSSAFSTIDLAHS